MSVAKDLNPDMDQTANEEPVKPEVTVGKKQQAAVEESKESSSSSEEKSDSDSDISGDSLCASEREHRLIKKREEKLAKLTYH